MPIKTDEQQTMDKHSSANSLLPRYTLDDLILPIETLQDIKDFLSYQEHEDLIYNVWGLAKTHKHQRQIAINLYGEPGTGKTIAAQAIASSLNRPIIAINYSEIESKYVGETSKNITGIFKQAKDENAVIFFDEADALLSRRVTNMSSSTDVSVNQTRSVLLTLMDQHIGIIIFTTNFIENYDAAFMRRILTHILFELPNLDNRAKLWHKYIPRELPLSWDVSIPKLAEVSKGLSGSDIANCILKAAMSASRKGNKDVDFQSFINAIDQVNKSKKANRNSDLPYESRLVDEVYINDSLSNNLV